MLVYKVTSAAETKIDWGDCTTGEADVKGAISHFKRLVATLSKKVYKALLAEGMVTPCHPWHRDLSSSMNIMCFTDGTNFRKAILPTYKSNRAGKEKPLGYHEVKAWVEDNFKTYQRPGLEGDDCIGILATSLQGRTVIVSGDKDFKTIPGLFYDFGNDRLHNISQEQADYWHLYQTLMGDTTDGYKGCPGIGKVKAKAILAPFMDEQASRGQDDQKRRFLLMWQAVVKTFVAKGLTEAEALVQAQVARILRKEDYDMKSKKPLPWQPPFR